MKSGGETPELNKNQAFCPQELKKLDSVSVIDNRRFPGEGEQGYLSGDVKERAQEQTVCQKLFRRMQPLWAYV